MTNEREAELRKCVSTEIRDAMAEIDSLRAINYSHRAINTVLKTVAAEAISYMALAGFDYTNPEQEVATMRKLHDIYADLIEILTIKGENDD